LRCKPILQVLIKNVAPNAAGMHCAMHSQCFKFKNFQHAEPETTADEQTYYVIHRSKGCPKATPKNVYRACRKK
jgi:hypothetical protein